MNKVITNIDVRYQETDQMGVVYHANYLIWFEIGRTQFIKHLGLNYQEMEERGIVSPVMDAHVSFKHPIHYGDDVTVETWLENYDGIRTVYGYHVLNGDGVIAVQGTTTHVIVKKESFRPLSLRRTFPDWHQAYTGALDKEV